MNLWVESASFKLNSIEVLIYRALTDSVIIRDNLLSISNVLKEYNYIKEEIKS